MAAGFGSQVAITLYERWARGEQRIADEDGYLAWLRRVVGGGQPVALNVWKRNLVAKAAPESEMRNSVKRFERERRAQAPTVGDRPAAIDNRPAAIREVPVAAQAAPADNGKPATGIGMLSWANKALGATPAAAAVSLTESSGNGHSHGQGNGHGNGQGNGHTHAGNGNGKGNGAGLFAWAHQPVAAPRDPGRDTSNRCGVGLVVAHEAPKGVGAEASRGRACWPGPVKP
jgi:hypothetical protein